MKLMVIILNKLEALEYLLEGLSSAGIGGATIIESSGMAMTLNKLDASFVSSSIKAMFSSSGNEDNRTIISVIRNDQLEIARKVIYSTVGDLSMPNTGILFTLPIDFAEGIKKNRGSIMGTAEEINEARAKEMEEHERRLHSAEEFIKPKEKKHWGRKKDKPEDENPEAKPANEPEEAPKEEESEQEIAH